MRCIIASSHVRNAAVANDLWFQVFLRWERSAGRFPGRKAVAAAPICEHQIGQMLS
jgi:hypothetical protein